MGILTSSPSACERVAFAGARRNRSSRTGSYLCISAAMCALLLLSATAAPHAEAEAATWPVSSSQPAAAVGFHETYSAGNTNDRTYVHSGVDASASAGSQIVSPIAGEVCFTGSVPSGDSSLNGGGPGQTMLGVSVKMPDGRTITLMPFAHIGVKKGDHVAEGEVLGTLAATGDRSMRAAHLHMGLKRGRVYYDPMSLFGMPSQQAQSVPATAGAKASAAQMQTAPAGQPLAATVAEPAVQGAPANALEDALMTDTAASAESSTASEVAAAAEAQLGTAGATSAAPQFGATGLLNTKDAADSHTSGASSVIPLGALSLHITQGAASGVGASGSAGVAGRTGASGSTGAASSAAGAASSLKVAGTNRAGAGGAGSRHADERFGTITSGAATLVPTAAQEGPWLAAKELALAAGEACCLQVLAMSDGLCGLADGFGIPVEIAAGAVALAAIAVCAGAFVLCMRLAAPSALGMWRAPNKILVRLKAG